MAFKIHGEVSLDGAMFKKTLHEASAETVSFLKEFALGYIGIESVRAALDKTIESAEELVNTSRKLDTSIEQLQVLRQAAKDNGIEFQAMASAMEKYNVARQKALGGGEGSAKMLAAFQRLGINREELQNNTAATSIMGGISETARKSNAADIAGELREVFGKSGTELFGVLKTDFEELGKEMHGMGALMDATTAISLKKFKDEMDLIGGVLIKEIAPVLVLFGKAIFNLVTLIGATVLSLAAILSAAYHLATDPIGTIKGEHSLNEKIDKAFGAYKDSRQGEYDKLFNQKEAVPSPQSEIEPEIKAEKTKTAKREQQIKSDSLISVGNFLGAGRGAISDVSQQHLQVAREQLAVSKETQKILEKNAFEMRESLLNTIQQDDWNAN